MHDVTALGDGADAELGLTGCADLAGDKHVEGCTERRRDLGCDGHTSARQRQNDRIDQVEGAQRVGQTATRLTPIREATQARHHVNRSARHVQP